MIVRLTGFCAGWLALALPAAAAPAFTIHVETERTGSTTSYDAASQRSRMSGMSVTAVRYTFNIRASAAAPESAEVEWVVLIENEDGKPQECAHGQTTASFPKNSRRAVVETEHIGVTGSDRSRAGGGGFASALYGYGIRLTDAEGNVLAEKYSPSGAERAITWRTAPPPAKTTAPRPTVPMPVVF